MSTVENAAEADAMFADAKAREAEQLEDLSDHQQTRADLESTHVPDGGTETELATVSTESGETDEQQGFAMTVDRRAGTTHLDIAYVDDDGDDCEDRMAFGKPSGRASTQLLAPLETMEDDDAPLSELTGYLWPTLAAWCCEEGVPGVETSPQDPDFWADKQGLGDSIGTLRDMALGNPTEAGI